MDRFMKRGLLIFLVIITLAIAFTPIAHMEEDVGFPVAEGITKKELLQQSSSIVPPDKTFIGLDGTEYKISDFKGKIVLLNFWATWCTPCKDELPLFQKIHEMYDDVVILSVLSIPTELRKNEVTTDDAGAVGVLAGEYVTEQELTFLVALDTDGAIFSDAAYLSDTIPVNYLIDREGILRFSYPGAFRNFEAIDQVLSIMRVLDGE